MATILYARVSTSEQTADHQCSQAESAGFVIDRAEMTPCDNGFNFDDYVMIYRPPGGGR